jgi:AraC-like DNA-binding protein
MVVKIDLPLVVDPVGEALHFFRVCGTFYCRSEFGAPWALAIPAMEDSVMLHVLMSGRCFLEVDGSPRRMLQPGDLALVPHGEGHVLTSAPGLPAAKLFEIHREPVSERYETLRLGGDGEQATMICGLFKFDDPAAKQLVALLPKIIAVDTWDSAQADWIHSTLRMIAAEAKEMSLGGETVITRLADILVVQAIRFWITHDPSAQTGWLGALQDPKIGKVISKVHRDPGRAWTLDLLAREASMSRSAFAARFTELVGEPVMHYVTRWRMHSAHARLREGNATVSEVALTLGYESEAAFNRAFRRHLGISPGMAKRARKGPRSDQTRRTNPREALPSEPSPLP